jgi:3-deoxy-manno-octulosonate cytidylyltransferase (CMP-KDO synthetase)
VQILFLGHKGKEITELKGSRKVKVLACIPARYDSTRFPGKVLAQDTGKFLIQHTYERVLLARRVDEVLIATDSDQVRRACESFGAPCVLTSRGHQSGTDRIAEAVSDIDVEIVVNVQADEPEIDPGNIDCLAQRLLERPDRGMATLVARFQTREKVGDPNTVKVIVDSDANAIYFSRSIIPFDREAGGGGQHRGVPAACGDLRLPEGVSAQNRVLAADHSGKNRKA